MPKRSRGARKNAPSLEIRDGRYRRFDTVLSIEWSGREHPLPSSLFRTTEGKWVYVSGRVLRTTNGGIFPGKMSEFYLTLCGRESVAFDDTPQHMRGWLVYELTRDEAIQWFREHGHAIPEELRNYASDRSAAESPEYAALRASFSATEKPPNPKPPAPVVPQTRERVDALIGELRMRRAGIRAALLEYMQDRQGAEFADIAHEVHGDAETSEEAIRKNVQRANEDLAEKAIPLRLVTSGSRVYKDERPA